jgi:hypothetical protein
MLSVKEMFIQNISFSGSSDDAKARADIVESVTKLDCPFEHQHQRVCLTSIKELKAHVKVRLISGVT